MLATRSFSRSYLLMDPLSIERIAAGIAGNVAQIFYDAKRLVVLRHPVGTRHRAGLDLQRIGAKVLRVCR